MSPVVVAKKAQEEEEEEEDEEEEEEEKEEDSQPIRSLLPHGEIYYQFQFESLRTGSKA
jgi:hypothetical protein